MEKQDHRIFVDEDSDKFRWTEFPPDPEEVDDGHDVVEGLSEPQKTLPPKYFYDAHGSQLFEKICDTPEYYPTRTEEQILAYRAPQLVDLTGPCELIELGSGSARKTRALIEAYLDKGVPVRFLPVDVSGSILKESSRELVSQYPELEIWGLIGTYEQALSLLPPRELSARMMIFLGSTIGNLTDDETASFLSRSARALKAGEYFLIGFDLQKDPAVLEAAYNDADGVTADFNLNILRHLNRRYGGDLDPAGFEHLAFYNREEHRIEMHLKSRADQHASLEGLGLEVDFEKGETIRTEISRKFSVEGMVETFDAQGFDLVQHWTDPNDWFALALFQLR